MLDIKFIRENSELIAMASKKKHIVFDVKQLIAVDDKRRALLQTIEEKRSAQNKANATIASATGADREKLIADMAIIKEELGKAEESLAPIMKEWQLLMLAVPNIPDISVPEGESDLENKEVKMWGDKPRQTFDFKSHVEIMEALDMVDLKKGSEVAGFRGYFLKGAGARLSFALWQYAIQFFTARGGFVPMIVPSLVRRETLLGSGYLPQGEEDLYKTQDGEYLAGTGEVATMSYFSDTVLLVGELPKKVLAFSPCFRREAGSHGKDTKGLIRVHEFYKLEQVVICKADHEESVRFHEELNENTEAFIESLGIPYRTVANCGGDLGLGQVKKYDIELWVPSERKYREISSASYFHDFQTRRLNIKYKDETGKMRFAHSLNCTAAPTPRLLVSIIENYQDADGTIRVPEPLKALMGVDRITR